MRILALVNDPQHVCVRYRLSALQPGLREAGHSLEIQPFESTLLARLRQYRSSRHYDAVVLQRTLLNRFELSQLRSQAPRLFFDFDDAIWRRDSYQANGGRSGKLKTRFESTMRSVDGVLAGNAFLAEQAVRHGFLGRATVAPTCIPVNDYAPSGHSSEALVWIGSSSTLRSLEAERGIFTKLGGAFPNLRLKMICDRFADFDPLKVERIPWQSSTEASELASSAIGVAVMPDDDWSRGKCGVKVLQYMAAGLPVIANPVGVHNEMIVPGINGFLAATVEQWIDAVTKLQDRPLRLRMGQAARELAVKHFSVPVAVKAWDQALNPLARRIAC